MGQRRISKIVDVDVLTNFCANTLLLFVNSVTKLVIHSNVHNYLVVYIGANSIFFLSLLTHTSAQSLSGLGFGGVRVDDIS